MNSPVMTPKRHLSPRQVALALGVSEASVKRWCDRGKLRARRTEGGHRRLELADVLEYVRAGELPLERPEILGLPPGTRRGRARAASARAGILETLTAGDDDGFGAWAYSLYLDGKPVAEIFDQYVAPAFREIGECWEDGSVAVYQERRAAEVCTRLIHQWRDHVVPAPPEGSPLAIGGALRADPYTLPTAMIDLALREEGWRAESHGIGLPAETLVSAMEEQKPRLVWLTVSAFDSEEELLAQNRLLYATASDHGIAYAVGGRALTEDVRQKLDYSAYCDSLRRLIEFARALRG